MSNEEVITRVEGRAGRLRLNRPQALNALTLDMVEIITNALLAWRNDPAVQVILLDHNEGRGFCAGGDIRLLAESGAGDGAEARNFFFTEYRLNHLMYEYPKPIVVIMDGVTMGGGVGLSLPARYRIATDRTTFAMPETGIGLFPDVGGGFHLPRLRGKTGYWLGMTGARIKAADCLYTGIATDYVESQYEDELKARICNNRASVETILKAYDCDPGPAPIAEHLSAIDHCFAANTVEGIIQRLGAMNDEWANEQIDGLATKSPQTLKVALRQLMMGAHARTFAENMETEYRIAARVVQRHDFLEGVRAVIVDKDNAPKWNPESLKDVTAGMLQEIFAPLPPGEEWTPLPQEAIKKSMKKKVGA